MPEKVQCKELDPITGKQCPEEILTMDDTLVLLGVTTEFAERLGPDKKDAKILTLKCIRDHIDNYEFTEKTSK